MPMTDASLAAMSAHDAVVVVAEHLVKRLPSGVLAIDDISIAIPRGAIHAVVGEAGSGLSSLMRLMSGVEIPDSGRLAIDGQLCLFHSLRESAFATTALIPQRTMLLPALTVAQNVVLGAEPAHGPFLGVRRGRESVLELGRRHGLRIDPDWRVVSLSSSQKQRVEILKALYRGVRVLLLDEPTALLPADEAEALFESLKSLAASGITVVIGSHRPAEAWRMAESFTVIRAGRVAARGRTLDVSEAQLASLMGGTTTRDLPAGGAPESPNPPCRLKAVDLTLRDSAGNVLLDRVSLDIGAGEILGLAVSAGHARNVLIDVLAGLTAADAGSVLVNGRRVNGDPDAHRQSGIAVIREARAVDLVHDTDRDADADADIRDSADPTSFDAFEPQVGRRGWLDARVAAPRAREIIRRQRLRNDSNAESDRRAGTATGTVSSAGSTIRPQAVLAVLPAPDSGTATDSALRDDLLAWRVAGAGVLMITSNVDALIEMSDRIAVLVDGRLVSHFLQSSVSAQAVRRSMAGAHDRERVAAMQASPFSRVDSGDRDHADDPGALALSGIQRR